VASHRTQWIKNPRIYHSSRLRVFSRKGAKTQSFAELRNSEFLATRYVGDCYISNAVPDPDAPAPSIISASPSVTSAPLRFVEFRPQGDGQPPESTRLPAPMTCATDSQATCQPTRLARALATRGQRAMKSRISGVEPAQRPPCCICEIQEVRREPRIRRDFLPKHRRPSHGIPPLR